MKKQALLPLLALLAVLASCGKNGDAAPYQVSDAQALIDASAFSGVMTEVDNAVVPALYGLDNASITECICYKAANSSVSADEVAVFVMESADEAETAAAACKQRAKDQADVYQTYGPDQVPRLEDAAVLQRDNTVLLAVGDPEKLPAALKDLKLD